MTHKIGYKKPPKKNQFKPGVSGNPNGRKKGTRNFISELWEELNQQVEIIEEGVPKLVAKKNFF